MIDFRLESFEGPLDLLLRLIEKNKIDLCDIPVAALTHQYLEAIGNLPADMEDQSSFLLMAATLLELKSRLLLPRPQAETADGGEDPRYALARRLEEYRHCKEMAERLRECMPPGERVTRLPDPFLRARTDDRTPDERLNGIDMRALRLLFTDALRRQELKVDTVRAGYGEMKRERFTVEEKMAVLTRRLKRGGKLNLAELFQSCGSRVEVVAFFLAVLELVRRGGAQATQRRVFDEIHVESA